jgi:hypothetical protein
MWARLSEWIATGHAELGGIVRAFFAGMICDAGSFGERLIVRYIVL